MGSCGGQDEVDWIHLDERLRATEAHLKIAEHLDSGPPIRAVKGGVKEQEKARDTYRIQSKFVCHFLYALVLENLIKAIWDLDKRTVCRDTHDISALYKELSTISQREIKDIFDEQLSRLAGWEIADKAGQKKKLGEVVPFQSWEEFLGANADIVRDFKYDNKLKGSSSVMGSLIWNSETFWALPPGSPLFATKIFRYATTRIQKTGRGTS